MPQRLTALTLAALLAAAAPAGTAAAERAEPQTEKTLAEAGAEAAKDRAAADARGVREIGWEELMPEGEEERLAELYQQQMAMLYSGGIVEGSSADVAQQFGTFKPALAELCVERLGPIAEEARRLMDDPAEIDRVLGGGGCRARAIADPILNDVKDILGFVRATA